jgi:hypothetical protein
VEVFNFPTAPDTTFPDAHVYADVVIWSVAIGLLVLCLRDWRRTGSPLGLVLLAGGALAYFNEPVDDILGLVHHPREGQNVVLDTMGPIPMWGLPTYIIFFGGVPYLFLREIQTRGFTLRAFWIGIGLTFVLDLLLEMPLLYAGGGLYQYYAADGNAPMEIFRFPVYWLFINTTGPILCAAILYAIPGYFRGWRAPFLVLLPAAADAACSIVVGLPVYSSLHAPGASELVRWGAALLTCAIGLFLLDGFSRWILARNRALQRDQAVSAPDSGPVVVPAQLAVERVE